MCVYISMYVCTLSCRCMQCNGKPQICTRRSVNYWDSAQRQQIDECMYVCMYVFYENDRKRKQSFEVKTNKSQHIFVHHNCYTVICSKHQHSTRKQTHTPARQGSNALKQRVYVYMWLVSLPTASRRRSKQTIVRGKKATNAKCKRLNRVKNGIYLLGHNSEMKECWSVDPAGNCSSRLLRGKTRVNSTYIMN